MGCVLSIRVKIFLKYKKGINSWGLGHIGGSHEGIFNRKRRRGRQHSTQSYRTADGVVGGRLEGDGMA